MAVAVRCRRCGEPVMTGPEPEFHDCPQVLRSELAELRALAEDRRRHLEAGAALVRQYFGDDPPIQFYGWLAELEGF